MKYINSIHIDGFRGFKDFKLSNLKDINILVGDNNVGKTSLLEAINILEYPGEIGHYINVCRKREGEGKTSAYSIFKNTLSRDNNDLKKDVLIEANINNKEIGSYIVGDIIHVFKSDAHNKELEAFEGALAYHMDGGGLDSIETRLYLDESTDKLKISSRDSFSPVSVVRVMPFDHVDKELTNSVVKAGKKQEIINVLKVFDSEITGIEMVKEDGEIKTYIEHKKTGLLPLSAYGDGLKKVAYLSSVIISAENAVLLIDEIETAIHHSALEEVFKWFIEACDLYNVQLFATTHSEEALDALLLAAINYEGKNYLKEFINVITLKRDQEYSKTKVRILDGLRAYEAREDFDMELRG